MFKKSINKKDLHPFLAVLFVLLQTYRLYNENISVKLIYQILLITGVLGILIVIVQQFIWKKLFNSAASISVLITFIILSFLLWEPSVNTIRSLFGFIRERYLFVSYGISLLFIFVILINLRRKKLSTLTSYTNILLAVLSLFEFYNLIFHPGHNNKINIPELQTLRYKVKPDIYFILLDGYSNPQSTHHFFGFQNNDLTDSLRLKGFYIAEKSKSNYKFTLQTIASSLNMDYLGNPLPELLVIFKSIKDNILTKSLIGKGYKFENLSIFSFGNQPAPFLLESYSPSSFEYYDVFLSRSIAGTFIRNLHTVELNSNDIHEKTMQGFRTMDELIQEAQTNSPQFVYLHSLISHGPFWMNASAQFDSNVVIRNKAFANADLARWHDDIPENNNLGDINIEQGIIKDYQNHLKISNTFTLNSVNLILARKPNSIIIVMSDHGFRFLMRHSLKDTKAEQYSNFCAIYFPDQKYDKLYNSITPVNVFRAVLNNALGTSIPFLPDKSGL